MSNFIGIRHEDKYKLERRAPLTPKHVARLVKQKKLDIIIANTPAAIGSERCDVWVKNAGQEWRWFADATKRSVAGRLIRMIEQSMQMD